MRHFNKLLAAAGLAMVMATNVYAETVSPQYAGSLVAVEGIVSQVSKRVEQHSSTSVGDIPTMFSTQ
jgi:hypothetical protein